MAKGKVHKKKVKVDAMGQAHISATFNNVIISLTNAYRSSNFLVISWQDGIPRGQRKNTPYAAQVISRRLLKRSLRLRA
jgi:small subunit ribosomal protein S11